MPIAMKYGSGNSSSKSGGTTTLLWTNPDPTSNFSAQTISLNLSGYDAVKVLAAQNTSSSSGVMVETTKDYEGRLFMMYNARYYRGFTWSDTGVTFTDGYQASLSSNLSANNSAAIPIYIYGVRYG